MLNKLRAIWLAAFVCLVFGFVGAARYSSQHSTKPIHNQRADKSPNQRTYYNPFTAFWDWTTHDAVSFYTSVLAIFTGVLGATAIVQIRYLRRADETARVTAKAARDAAEVAAKSANVSLLALRPWVSCKVKIIGDLIYRANGDPCIAIRFTLKNKGHSPAMGVQLYQRFHLLSPVHTHSILAQQRIADLLKDLPPRDYGLLLFPRETHTFNVKLPISRMEIEKSIEDIKPKKTFFPELIVLVTYTYPLASHNPQTGYIFRLEKIVPDETYGFAFDLDEGIVPAANIALRRHDLWGAYAT
jgi:hypothetical protein